MKNDSQLVRKFKNTLLEIIGVVNEHERIVENFQKNLTQITEN
jgi:hypothetical protein